MTGFSEFAPSESEAEHWANSLRGWVLRSPLLVRLGISAGLVFLWGFFGRFENLVFVTLVFALLALVGVIWAGFAAFARSSGFIRSRDSNRWLRLLVWVVALPLLLPVGYTGNNTALTVAPYSDEELKRFAEAEATAQAEVEALEAEERASVAAEEAAEEEKRRLEEAREAEFVRVTELVGALSGLTEAEALVALEDEGLTARTEQKCDEAEEGIVIGGEVDSDDPSFVVLKLSKNPTAVPDVVGASEAFAKQELEKACYRMQTAKSYYTTERAGTIVAQDPVAGETLEADTEVQVMASSEVSGATRTEDSVGSWSYLGPQEEEWAFRGPFEIDGKLYIPIEAAFSASMSWRDSSGSGTGFGTAIIVDEFNKEVPVEVLYGRQNIPSGEIQNFTAVIPLTDLDDQTPTKVFLYLSVEVGGTSKNLTADFTMTW